MKSCENYLAIVARGGMSDVCPLAAKLAGELLSERAEKTYLTEAEKAQIVAQRANAEKENKGQLLRIEVLRIAGCWLSYQQQTQQGPTFSTFCEFINNRPMSINNAQMFGTVQNLIAALGSLV